MRNWCSGRDLNPGRGIESPPCWAGLHSVMLKILAAYLPELECASPEREGTLSITNKGFPILIEIKPNSVCLKQNYGRNCVKPFQLSSNS
jgi:hypothetical protein